MLEKEDSLGNEEVLDIDNVIEEKEVTIEEILEENEEVREKSIKVVKNNTFMKDILAGVIDQIIVMAGSLATLLIFDLILRLFGYYIVEKQPMFLIIYIIINIIYGPVCKKLKFKETVGKKVLLDK